MKSSTTSQAPADTGKSGMKAAILSLSLLTVMAGAAVAPALDLIRQYFSSTPTVYVQLIISMPALFIAVTNLFFGRLTQHFRSKTLVIFALILYLVFGCGAGLFRHLVPILICRALVGVSVGIIMPLSAFRSVLGSVISGYSSFHAAMIISLVLFVWSFTIRNPGPSDKV